MSNYEDVLFETLMKQNKRRIYYHINKLRIHDPHEEFYQAALIAMWNAYETYNPDKGPLSTYFNFVIRNRLIDLIRKKERQKYKDEVFILEEKGKIDDGNRACKNGVPIVDRSGILIDDANLWKQVQLMLTAKQWIWVECYIILDMSIKEISKQEGVSKDAVKSWGQQARKNLRCDKFKVLMKNFIDN